MVNFIKKNPCFQISGNKLFCNVCDQEKNYNSNQGLNSLKAHLSTNKYRQAILIKREQKRLSFEQNADVNIFHTRLLKALIKANIPLNKLDNKEFKSFLEKKTGKQLSPKHFIELYYGFFIQFNARKCRK